MKIYFLGIGGIGMSALARYYHRRGAEIHGYDRVPSPLTNKLIDEGMYIHFEDNPDEIPSDIDLCIYTPAVPMDNREFLYFKQSGIRFVKRSQVLGEIAAGKTCYAVAGTHGKTSITAMLAHIMRGQRPITAFIGGISANYNTNLIDVANAQTMLVEADEFDRSFLSLEPDIAVITAIDPDHLDIYGTTQQLYQSFNEFVQRIKPNGVLLLKSDLISTITPSCAVRTYSLDDTSADYHVRNLYTHKPDKMQFDFVTPLGLIQNMNLEKIGMHNLENAVAAAAVCHLAGVEPNSIRQPLKTYKGVKRRFEYIINRPDFVYIDDYAHHPQEIKACVESVRKMHPDKKVCGVFQPHLFSRTRDLADGFARSLELLDTVVLLDIYPAREQPIKGVDSKMLLNKINKTEKFLVGRDNLIDCLKNIKPEIIVTMGAGDIDRLVMKIKYAFDGIVN